MLRALLVGLGVLVALAVAVVVAAPILVERRLSAEAMAERGSALAGRPVTIERVGVTWRPDLRIRAEGVTVEGAASAGAVEVELAWRPLLLERRVVASELHLLGPRLLVERRSGGGVRVRILHPPGAGEASPGGGLPLAALPAVDARDGTIVLVGSDGRPTGAPVLRIRRLDLGPFDAEDRTPFALDVALDPREEARLGLDALQVDGSLELAEGSARLRDGRATASGLRFHGLLAERCDGRLAYASGRVEVRSLACSGYGGNARAEGALALERPPSFDGRLELAGLDLAGMIADWRGGEPLTADPGDLDAEGDVTLRLAGAERGTGDGRFELRGGTLPAASLFSELLGVLGTLTGQVLSLGKAAAPSPSAVEHVTASWTLRDERLHTEDLEVVTGDYRYAARGSAGLDGSVALTGSLHLTSRGAQRLLTSAALPVPGLGKVLPPIPLDVGGRLSSPEITARASGIPGAARGVLGGLVRTGEGVVGGAVRGGKAVLDKALGR